MKKSLLVIIVLLMAMACFVAGCSDSSGGTKDNNLGNSPATVTAITESALHISHIEDSQYDYGKGDYLYDTITFSGSALGSEQIISVRDLESLISDQTLALGYESAYSFKNSGGAYSQQTFTGLRLYDYLLYLGMKDNLPDKTSVAIHAKDGNVITLQLGQIKADIYKYYGENEQLLVENLPVMLSCGSSGIPLVGPTGDQLTTTEFTAEMGYDGAADNVGGPVKLTLGQTDFSDFNARYNNKWVDRITVGEEENYALHSGSHAAQKALTVAVYQSGQNSALSNKSYTWSDLESFAASSSHNKVRNYYGDGNFYEGVNLWSLLAQDLNLPSYEGYVELIFADGSQEEVDLAYLQNISGSYSNYITEKDGLTITCVKPVLAYSKEGAPLADAVIAALPQDGKYKTSYTLQPLSELHIHLGEEAGVAMNTAASAQTLNLKGEGLKQESAITLAELGQELELKFTADYKVEGQTDEYSGINLLRFLQQKGLMVDAENIIISNEQDSLTLSLSDLQSEAANAGSAITMLAYSKKGQTLAAAEGGPILLLSQEGSLSAVTSIEVTAKAGQWNHFDGNKELFESYLDEPVLRIYGSEAAQDITLTLRQLEGMTDSRVRDSYASGGGSFGYEGIILRDLVQEYLTDGYERPSAVTVTDGAYYVSVNIDDLYNGIESQYQEGQVRDMILAYGIDGVPLVPDENSVGYDGTNSFGPLRLVVENSFYQWVKGVSEIIIGEAENANAAVDNDDDAGIPVGPVIILIIIIAAVVIVIFLIIRTRRKK